MAELLKPYSVDSLHAWLPRSTRSLWLGALSFEDRCTASLEAIAGQGCHVTKAIALDYETTVSPSAEAEHQRSHNWGVLSALGERTIVQGIHKMPLAAYQFQALQDALAEVLSQVELDVLIVDITCLTKIHALAIAASLAAFTRPSFRWVVAYTIPENYVTLWDASEDLPHWRDVIVAPLAETALLFNEASGRGIIIPGHEADRLILALAEIEPAGGLVIVGDTRRRPDLRYVTQRKNQRTVQQLTRMRASNWVKYVVSVTDLANLRTYVGREIALAKEHQAPVILFPYGPKSILFATAYQLASEYPECSWFVYPVPSSYDANYSTGAEETVWLAPGEGV